MSRREKERERVQSLFNLNIYYFQIIFISFKFVFNRTIFELTEYDFKSFKNYCTAHYAFQLFELHVDNPVMLSCLKM